MKFVQCRWMPGAAIILLSGACLAGPPTNAVEFNIPAQALEKSLRDIHSQAPHVFLLVPAEIDTTAKAPAVRGRLTPEAALTRLLRKSGVTLTFVPPGTFTLHVEHHLEGPAPPEVSSGIPEIFVKGSRTLNTDPSRTENDAFAYTIFGVLPARVRDFPKARRLACLPLARCEQEEIECSPRRCRGSRSGFKL